MCAGKLEVFPFQNSGAGAPHPPGKGEAPSETCLRPWAVEPYVICFTIVLQSCECATSSRLAASRLCRRRAIRSPPGLILPVQVAPPARRLFVSPYTHMLTTPNVDNVASGSTVTDTGDIRSVEAYGISCTLHPLPLPLAMR